MRKIYSLIASALLMIPAASFAQTMTEENPTLVEMGYRLEKDVNFRDGFVNGKEIEPNNGLQFTGKAEEPKINSYNPQRVTNTGLEWLSLSLPGNSMDLVYGTGLKSSSNERWIGIHDLREGQIIAIDISNTDPASFVPNSIACNSNTGWADTWSDPLIVEEISEEVHSLQDLGGGEGEEAEEGEEVESNADNYRYFKVINAGTCWAKFNGKSPNNIIYRMQIWSSNEEPEVVTNPSLKVVGVDGADRQLEFIPGKSTYGGEVKTFYSLDGGDPIFLKESDEIDYEEYIYATDEEGNTLLDENGDPVIEETIPHYKKVLDTDKVEEVGAYGDEEYDGSGNITVYGSGESLVVVKAASVSVETGVVSEVVSIDVPVGDITLNAPTLTLYGFDGETRSYSLSWTNNTICGEEYSFLVEGDGGDLYNEEMREGDLINIKQEVTVKVMAQGYTEGVTIKEADYPGINIHRKAAKIEDEEGNPIHDWDFTNLTEEQKKIVKGEVIEGYYVITENGDSLVCSYEDYVANDGVVNGVDFTEGIEIYAPTSWDWSGTNASNNRATLNVVEGGNNVNANGYGYVEDVANIFPNMLVNCAPNANNASTIFIYIGRANGSYGNLGAYFMARPEFTFPRSAAAAGEFVLIQGGTGGSNWTNAPYPIIRQVPEDGLLTVNGLPGNGYHVFYIDVYTYDELPEDLLDNAGDAWNEAVAIEGVNANGKAVVGIYTVSGAKLSAPQKGINIVKYADGTAAKVLVK